MSQSPLIKWAGVIALAFLVAGCTRSRPIQIEDLVQRGQQHTVELQARLAELGGELSLEHALLLGLDRNLDLRIKAMDAAIASGDASLTSLSMLPSLTAEAGYRRRDRFNASFSESISTGTVSLVPSRSSDLSSRTASLELSWNMLDFGMAWARTANMKDSALISSLERERMAQAVIRELVYSWERARAFQLISEDLARIESQVRQALQSSDEILARRRQDPMPILEYRKELLLFLKQINQLSYEMQSSYEDLMRLLNLPPGAHLSLSGDADWVAQVPEVKASLQAWQLAALIGRPEVKTQWYRERMSSRSQFQQLMETFPALMLSYSAEYDGNRFLLHNDWRESSARVSWNLIKLASVPERRRQMKRAKSVAQARLNLEMTAVLSQVAIADKSLDSASASYCLSRSLSETDAQRLGYLEGMARQAMIDNLSIIRERTDNLLLVIEERLGAAEQRRAKMLFLASLGVGVTPPDFSYSDEGYLEKLREWNAAALGVHLRQVLDEVQLHFADVTIEGNISPTMRECDL